MAPCRQVGQGEPLESCHSMGKVKDRNDPALGKGRRASASQAKRVNGQSPRGGTEPSLFRDLQDHCLEPSRRASRAELAQTAMGQSKGTGFYSSRSPGAIRQGWWVYARLVP